MSGSYVCIPQKRNCYFQNKILMFCLPVSTLIYLWEIYLFPGSFCLFCCREICGPILGIFISLTGRWTWKLGLRPRNSQKRNTEMGLSLQCSRKGCEVYFCKFVDNFLFQCNSKKSSSGKEEVMAKFLWSKYHENKSRLTKPPHRDTLREGEISCDTNTNCTSDEVAWNSFIESVHFK